MSTQRTIPGGSPKLAEALSQAQNIVAAAEKRADQLKAEAETIYQQARDKGYKEGFAAGQAEAVATGVRLIEDTTSLGDRLAEEAARLALAISATVVGEHVRLEPHTVKRIAFTALQESVIGDSVALIVHPDDQEVLANSLAEVKRLAGGASVMLECDPSLSRGGCVVRTEFGEVDASIEALLQGIATRLKVSAGNR